ncbi:MAG: hypothetical protein Fur0011_1220 [Candidatus Microgenomates bacterium]
MQTYTDKLDRVLSEYLVKKSPALPKGVKEFLVTIAPYLALLGAILGIPALLAVFGLGAIATPFVWIAGSRTGIFWLFWVVGAAQVVLSAMAVKPLFARRGKGWRLMYYSQLLSLLSTLQYFNIGSLVMTVVSFYLLYQVKASYGKGK